MRSHPVRVPSRQQKESVFLAFSYNSWRLETLHCSQSRISIKQLKWLSVVQTLLKRFPIPLIEALVSVGH